MTVDNNLDHLAEVFCLSGFSAVKLLHPLPLFLLYFLEGIHYAQPVEVYFLFTPTEVGISDSYYLFSISYSEAQYSSILLTSPRALSSKSSQH